jgi:hypothetical protein
MEKRLIYTLAIGEEYKDCFDLAHNLMRAYADKVKADLYIQTESEGHAHMWFEKYSLRRHFDKYDRILYVDGDVLINPKAPNIFEEVPDDKLALFNEGRFGDRKQVLFEYFNIMDYKGKWNEKYYNAGIMLIPKKYKFVFTPMKEHVRGYCDQDHTNYMINKHSIEVHDLSYHWNRMTLLDGITGEHRLNSNFIHYAGGSLIGAHKLHDVMKKDYDELIEGKIYPRYVAVMIGGGMGDQICAEPTLRYIKEKLYKNDEIIAVSHWPELFSHLGLKVLLPAEKTENANNYVTLYTLHDPTHDSWRYVAHMITTPVDYASILATRGTLPLEYKKIKLEYSQEDLDHVKSLVDNDLKDLILVHAGRHWQSKTFPASFWQMVVDTLKTKYRVAVIGKRVEKIQGVVEIDTTGCYDLIDKTTVKQLIALIGNSKGIITNDSVPVHMAGAFDDVWIGLIAITKHPHHVLPYRGPHNSQLHKAVALEQFPVYDHFEIRPTAIDGSKCDICSEEDLLKALPTKEQILKFVESIFTSNT